MGVERVSGSMSLMQAIFNIKAAWSGFSKLWKQHSHTLDQLDPETRSVDVSAEPVAASRPPAAACTLATA